MRILLLGDLPPDQLELEIDWAVVLRDSGHEPTLLVTAPSNYTSLNGSVERHGMLRMVLRGPGWRRRWIAAVERLLTIRRWDAVVAFNPVNLLLASSHPRRHSFLLHYHAHELVVGRALKHPFVHAERHLARRADVVSVPQAQRAVALAILCDLDRLPSIVPNYRALRSYDPGRGDGARSVAADHLLIADQADLLSPAWLTRLTKACHEAELPPLLVTGKGRALHNLRDYAKLCSRSYAAVTLTGSHTWNYRFAAPYRLGWFAALGIPQVATSGLYTAPFVESGAVVAVEDCTTTTVIAALKAVRERHSFMQAAAKQAHADWANQDLQLRNVPWIPWQPRSST